MKGRYVNGQGKKRFFPAQSIHREKKAWGEEQWIVNKEYCGKRLVLKKNRRCSIHMHREKDEVFFLEKGKVLLELDGSKHILKPGDFVHIPRNSHHRFTGMEDSVLFEFSTTHKEEDSYRSTVSGHVDPDRFSRQSAIVGKFSKLRVLVVGDPMLDSYLHGTAERLSPEAPIPVVRFAQEHDVPGGAANAARNAASLGAQVTFVGLSGSDTAAKRLEKLLKQEGVRAELVADRSRRTTLKQRVLSLDHHQLLRVDYEDVHPASDVLQKKLLGNITRLLKKHDVLLLSDYAKGTLSPSLLHQCIAAARKARVPVIVDPKPHGSAYIKSLKGATLLTPNRKEAETLLGSSAATAVLGKRLGTSTHSSILLTLGGDGMVLWMKGGKPLTFPAMTREVADVSGAGDTVAATAALAIAAGARLEDAVDLANRAAGVVVAKAGTATVTAAELLDAL